MFNRYIAKGNRYQMGYQVGEIFKGVIQKDINKYEELLKDNKVAESLDKLIVKLNNIFPNTYQELLGKAKGAQVDEKSLILMHCPELYKGMSGCTTAILKKEDRVLFSHNEDDYDMDNDKLALIKYEYDDHYVVGLTIYDRLVGSTHGYNSYGLVYSCNYIWHEDEKLDNLSRYLISRELVECKTIDECLKMIKKVKPAQPFSFNVLDINSNEVINIENDYEEEYITNISDRFVRSNHFINKENPKMSENSKYRLLYSKEGIEKLNFDANINDVRNVLCYENEEYVKSILMDPYKYKDLNDSLTLANMSIDSYKKEVIYTDYLDHTYIKYNMEEFDKILKGEVHEL